MNGCGSKRGDLLFSLLGINVSWDVEVLVRNSGKCIEERGVAMVKYVDDRRIGPASSRLKATGWCHNLMKLKLLCLLQRALPSFGPPTGLTKRTIA